MEAETVLEEAARVVDGPRGKDYGRPTANHGCTGAMFEAWLTRFWTAGADELGDRERVAVMTCAFNLCQKLSRLAQTPDHRDSLVDIAGYARNWEMVVTPSQPTPDSEGAD